MRYIKHKYLEYISLYHESSGYLVPTLEHLSLAFSEKVDLEEMFWKVVRMGVENFRCRVNESFYSCSLVDMTTYLVGVLCCGERMIWDFVHYFFGFVEVEGWRGGGDGSDGGDVA